tara:strand:+ start:331 stop:3078 length:2748 start_codon:yes stop_codon:yes gene_type:complete
MGRPSCSSCCKVTTIKKTGCVDDNYKIYYKYGAGGWKTSDEYKDYLKNIPTTIEVGIKVHYPIGSEDIYIVEDIIEGVAPDPDKVKLIDEAVPVDMSEVEPVKNGAGFRRLEEIKYVSSKSDYGEYASELNCWNYPKAFFDESKTADEINEAFQAGDPDYGVHIPKSWTITLGDNDEMVIVRKLEGLGSFTNYKVGQYGEYQSGRTDDFGSYLKSLPKYGSAGREANLFRSWYYGLIDGLASPRFDPLTGRNVSNPTDIKLQEKTYTAIWTTEILYKGQTIFSGSKCIPYKKEFHIYNYGVAITHAYAVSRKDSSNPDNCWTVSRDLSGCGFEKGDEVFTQNLMWFDGGPHRRSSAYTYVPAGLVWEELVPYSNFDYCLTFPFFSFDQNTHYFYEGPDSKFIPAPQGTIDEDFDGKLEFYHADKGLFTKISVISKDFIVFNPYSGSLGRDVEPNELAQEYQGDNLKEQEALVNTPFFQYTDNKLDLEGDMPQELTIEESPIGNLIEFPAGWPGDYAQPDGVRATFSKYGGRTTGYMEDLNNRDVFVPGWGPDLHNGQRGYWQRNGSSGYDINDVIFVHFRTNRGADESGIDIEEDMEVYHPVGDDDKYTIKEILEQGPNLKPTKVRLSNGAVVDVSDIELVDDALYYAMNKRTYYLQTIYLKALGGDFYNPFKYRVTRIDFTNPDIDIDGVGNEISGNPEMLDIEEGVKVLYPIGQVDENDDEIVPDEYTVAKIIEGVAPEPDKVRLSNPLADADGEVVYVSEVELINPSENPTYITMTTEYSYGNVPELRKKPERGEATFMKLTEDSPVTLEKTENPPMSLKDDIVITAPSSWSGPSKYDPNTGEFVKNPNVLGFPRSENLYVKVLNSWVLKPTADGSMDLAFGHRQLPKSGYFFGNFVNLKFYLQEIDEWKKA